MNEEGNTLPAGPSEQRSPGHTTTKRPTPKQLTALRLIAAASDAYGCHPRHESGIEDRGSFKGCAFINWRTADVLITRGWVSRRYAYLGTYYGPWSNSVLSLTDAGRAVLAAAAGRAALTEEQT